MSGNAKIDISKVGPRTVLMPREALTCQNCEDLETAFSSCLTHQRIEIALDLNETPYLDSEALELLVRMHEELRKRGSSLKIVRANELCRDILIATRLMSVLSVYENLSEAIKSGP
jgi:anti-anti-sigma factor